MEIYISYLKNDCSVALPMMEIRYFPEMCRRQPLRYSHRFRKDAIRGPICNNAEKVFHGAHERPQMKIINGRKPIQIFIKSTSSFFVSTVLL